MKIVCDATGIELDAAPEVAEALEGRGFTVLGGLLHDGGAASADDEGFGAAEDGSDDAADADAGGSVRGPDLPETAEFDGWEPTKEFLKGREIAELRAFAAVRKVELPKPANKGQIVNAIVAAFEE